MTGSFPSADHPPCPGPRSDILTNTPSWVTPFWDRTPQNLILPSGTAKIAESELDVRMNVTGAAAWASTTCSDPSPITVTSRRESFELALLAKWNQRGIRPKE
jgi:hypothetical protein